MTFRIYLLPLMIAAIAVPYLYAVPAQAQSGPRTFEECAGCHSVQKDQDGLGPSLYGIIGRRAGAKKGFEYSDAMKAQKFVWTQERLNRFIANPAVMIPDTSMTYLGMPDKKDRAAVIAYLKSLRK